MRSVLLFSVCLPYMSNNHHHCVHVILLPYLVYIKKKMNNDKKNPNHMHCWCLFVVAQLILLFCICSSSSTMMPSSFVSFQSPRNRFDNYCYDTAAEILTDASCIISTTTTRGRTRSCWQKMMMTRSFGNRKKLPKPNQHKYSQNHRANQLNLHSCAGSNLFVSPTINPIGQIIRVKVKAKRRKIYHQMTKQVIRFNQQKRNRQSEYEFQYANRRPLGTFITNVSKLLIVWSSFVLLKVLNKTYIHDPKRNLQRLIFERNDRKAGLLTISNHCSIIDDPGVWCATLPPRLLTLDSIRNIIMTEEAYYCLGKLSASILHGLNCLPIKRGDIRGLESPQLLELHKRLNGAYKREWCHIMIEGRICQSWRFELPHDHNLPRLGSFRLGAAKLIASSPPSKTLVLPIFHSGFDKIFPETPPDDPYIVGKNNSAVAATRRSGKTKLRFPRCGNRIDVYVGDPIDFRDIVPIEGYAFERSDYKSLMHEINSRLYEAMLRLEALASRDRM